MADSSDKNDKNDKEKKGIDKAMDSSGSDDRNLSICQEESTLENDSKNSEVHKEKEAKQVNDIGRMEQESDEQGGSTSKETKLPHLVENLYKRSKSEADDSDDALNQSGSDSNKDCSKRQKLKEFEPNTSISDDTERNGSSTSNFVKCGTRMKKRNYRSQTTDSTDDSIHEESNNSSSSESNESSDVPPIGEEVGYTSADERSSTSTSSYDQNESFNWTSASDDDPDEIPAVLQKEPPKSNWSFLKDVANRQIGSNYNIPQHFYSSLYAVQRLQLISQLEAHIVRGCVNTINFNEKGNLLASASDDLTVTIWDWARAKKHVTINTGHRSNVFQAKWLPLDEHWLVSSARDGQVRMIDIENGFTKKLAAHRAACNKLATHVDLPHVILSAGEDSKIFSIDVREKPSKLLSVKDDDQEVELYSVDSNPLNSYEFCVAGRMRYVNVYDRRKPTSCLYQMCPKHLLSDACAHMTCAVYNHNGTEVIATYNNEDIYLFDSTSSYQSGDFAHKYQGHCNSVTLKSVNFFGPNSEFIISGSDCGNIFVWDKKSEAIVQWMIGDHQGVVNALEPHPHIPILATSGLDCDVKIWSPSKEEFSYIKEELKSCVKKNLTNRTKPTEEAEGAFDNQLIWIMLSLRNVRHAARQRFAQRFNQNQTNMSDDFDDDDDDDEDDDEDDDDEDDDDLENDSNSSSSNNDTSENDSHSES